MPTPKTHSSPAHRQAAYLKRQKEARIQELAARGLPALPAIPSMPGTARWRAAINSAKILLETTVQEMEDYSQERSEQWQETDRAERMNESIAVIKEVAENLDDIVFD